MATALVAALAVVSWAEMAPGASFVSVAAPTLGAKHKDHDEGSPPARNPPPPAPPTPEPAANTPPAPVIAPAAPTPAASLADPMGERTAGSTAPTPVFESQGEVAGVESADRPASLPPATVSDRVIGVSATGTAAIPVTCQGPVACRGTVVIDVAASAARARAAGSRLVAARRGRRLRIGKAGFSVAPGSTATVRVRMSRRGRKLLGRSGRIKAKATIFSAGASTSFPITLRADRGGSAR